MKIKLKRDNNNKNRGNMADYMTKGNKTVMCRCKNMNTIPFQTTIYKCSTCGMMSCVKFFGTVTDKNGNFIF